jgi:streptogramin lyase
MAWPFGCRALCLGFASILLAGCAEASQGRLIAGAIPQSADYAQSSSVARAFEPDGKSDRLKYFSTLPNGKYPGDNLIEGPDKNLWYASQANGISGDAYTISKFSPGGTTTYAVPPLCSSCGPIEPTSLVNGPDGRIWFGTALSYVIGAMDTNGNVQYYNGPAPYCGPALCDIVLGAVVGQNIWFTSESLSKSYGYQLLVGYIETSTGTTKSYGTGFERTPPSQIVMGANGALWFGAGTNVASVGTYGGVNSFSTYPPMDVGSIISGPDRNLWFVSDGENQLVGRMKTNGKMLSETTLKSGEAAYQLTVGPDNHVWITTTEALVRMTSPTARKSIKVPRRQRDCDPVGITVGSDGKLWFSSASAGNNCSHGIGKVVLETAKEQGRETP